MNPAYFYLPAQDLDAIIALGGINPPVLAAVGGWNPIFAGVDGDRLASEKETITYAETRGGYCRILLHSESVRTRWCSAERQIHVHGRVAELCRKAILVAGADPRRWRFSLLEFVPVEDWIGVEKLVNGVWQPMPTP
jgi:hypothetical protein